MKIFIYDTEVFLYDWIAVFQDYKTQEFHVFHNDGDAVADFIDDDAIYIGFNSKAYDQFIIKVIVGNCDTMDIKDLSDYIIASHNGWDHPLVRQIRYWFNNVDIMDDMQKGLSLKAIEGHLGLSIEESTVDFNIDRPLTEDELEEVIHYCKHDVEATAHLVRLRKDYLQTKLNIGRMVGLDDAKALSMTNAKLTAAFLKAQRPLTPWDDEREYKYPANLKREYIPQEVFDFFNRMYDPEIPDEELFKSKLKLNVGEAVATIGYGGIHLGIPNYMWEVIDV